MPSDTINIDMPLFGPAYDILYSILANIFRKIVNDTYFDRMKELTDENATLKARLASAEDQLQKMTFEEVREPFYKPLKRQVRFHSQPLLPLHWPDSPV